ncbi:hypothetical protein [Dyella ginsengisoli]|uniref:hypothetical protein n=1 Tax=Dyella ginsengisoli TaxID=363848 RepID=UPI0003692C1A|nr:hypothetical protein [Dyella ginsengisoli]
MKGDPRNTAMTAPALCDACGRSCITLDQTGIVCYHCGLGCFMHRRFWQRLQCPDCSGVDATWCATCKGAGMLAEPKRDDDLDVADLLRAWEDAITRAEESGRADSPAIEGLRASLAAMRQ